LKRSTPLLLAVALLVGCPSAEPDGAGPVDGPAPGEAWLTLVGEYEAGATKVQPGLAVLPNMDDDNDNGTPDWADNEDDDLLGDDDELSSILIPASVWMGLGEDETYELSLHGQERSFRVRYDGDVVLGQTPDDDITTWTVPSSAADIELTVEARGFLAQTWISLDRMSGGESVSNDWSFITAAPLILNHHLQQTEHIWVTDVPESGSSDIQRFYNNQHMIETFEDVMGEMFTAVPVGDYAGDVWVQDEIQIGWMNSPGARTDLVIDSIRDRGLDDFPEDYIVGDGSDSGPDVINETWGNPLQANSLDSFGNLEVSPPVTVDGVEYPFGRIYFGGNDTRYPTRDLTDFLASQRIQKPFMPDTSWLCVGHIDEVVSTVPDPSSELGFKFIIADIPTAWDVLEDMDGSLDLPRYARSSSQMGHGMADVDAIVNNNALRNENEEIQEDILDPMREQFSEELGLTEDDILLMPSLFESLPGCGDAALIPGMVNMIVANRGDQTDVFLADPFTRDSDDPTIGQDEDPTIAHVQAMMPDTLDLHFVDNWAVYHAQLGEVHCGTNMMRTPSADWWSVGGHLLEEE
jgi:hypothetical protein